MRYITKDESGVITGDFDAPKIPVGGIAVPEDFCGTAGQNVAEFNEDWSSKPLSFSVAHGYVVVPEGCRLSDEGDRFVALTEQELYLLGVKPVPNGCKIDSEGNLRDKTLEELLADGLITESQYTSFKDAQAAAMRRLAFSEESDPMFWDYQDGKITYAEWRKKKEEIRARFPKGE